MVWGYPLILKSKRTGEPRKPKPVNNTRTDKLDSYMWRYSLAERRCLISFTAWVEAEGSKGGKTRTWLSLPDADLSAVAGIWRSSNEWGECYSMVINDAAGDGAQAHDRMPVLLSSSHFSQWTEGTTDEALGLYHAWTGELELERTKDRWTR